jgi:hypothetical protein
MAGASIYHLEDYGVSPYMHNTDQEAMRENHATSNVSRTGQVAYMQVLPNLAHTRGIVSIGGSIASSLYSPRYCMTEYSSVS